MSSGQAGGSIGGSVLLSRSTIRENAVRFAHAFRDASRESGERQLFWVRFFEIFGVVQEQVATFELLAGRASTGRHGWIDLLYPGQMGVEHKSLGEDLDEAMGQLLDYYTSLTPAEQPWLLIACDFQTWRWHNLTTGDKGEFALAELPDNLDLFWWIGGYGRPAERFGSEEDANFAATELLKVIHDNLSENGYGGHPIREWLTRILFCLFADDTGVWGRAAFHAYVAFHSRTDGSDLGATIETVFQILNTPPTDGPATSTRTWLSSSTSTATSSRSASPSRSATPRPVTPSWRHAVSSGRSSRRPSSGRCFRTSPRPETAANSAPTTRRRRTSFGPFGHCSSTS